MVDALINDGDIVLMQYVNSIENGEMAAVWLKENKEATVCLIVFFEYAFRPE